MTGIGFKYSRVFLPGFTNGWVRRFPSERLEVFGKIEGAVGPHPSLGAGSRTPQLFKPSSSALAELEPQLSAPKGEEAKTRMHAALGAIKRYVHTQTLWGKVGMGAQRRQLAHCGLLQQTGQKCPDSKHYITARPAG